MKKQAESMDFPSIIISNSLDDLTQLAQGKEILPFGQFVIIVSKELQPKVFISDTPDYKVFGHTNFGCKKKLQELGDGVEQVLTDPLFLTEDLHWGIVAIFCKQKREFILINDIYGIYPIYYSELNGQIYFSNDFDILSHLLRSLTINDFGVYDYLLFNSTLKSRTLFNEISQLEGNSKIVYNEKGCLINRRVDLDVIISDSVEDIGIEGMCNSLMKNIKFNINEDLPNSLPLTGGFDSKVVLSALLAQGYQINSFTFGIENSPDHIAATSTAMDLQVNHKFHGMTEEFLAELDSHLSVFIRNHPNAPMLDSLFYYLSIKDNLRESNLITGQMGGELIVGPVLISELITTRTFAMLSTVSEVNALHKGLISHVNQTGFLRNDAFRPSVAQYAHPLQTYMKRPGSNTNLNIIRFLLNETYAKFFGTVFSNLFSKVNIINPLVDIVYLRNLLNSKYRFTNKKPFKKAPVSHFISRRLYPKMIKIMQPSVLKTRMDRGYNLADFLHWYNFPKPFLNYARRHLSRKKAIDKIGPASYLEAIKKLTVEALPTSSIMDWDMFDRDSLKRSIAEMACGNASKHQEQKLIQLYTLHLIVDRYSDRISGTKG